MKYEDFEILAQAYIDDYKQTGEIYDALKKFDIYVEITRKPVITALERIFNNIHETLVDSLLDIANDGYTTFYIDDIPTDVNDLKVLYNIYGIGEKDD